MGWSCGWHIPILHLAHEYLICGIVTASRFGESIYSKRIVSALDFPEGLVRISPMHCHSTEDIDQFLMVTAEISGAGSRFHEKLLLHSKNDDLDSDFRNFL